MPAIALDDLVRWRSVPLPRRQLRTTRTKHNSFSGRMAAYGGQTHSLRSIYAGGIQTGHWQGGDANRKARSRSEPARLDSPIIPARLGDRMSQIPWGAKTLPACSFVVDLLPSHHREGAFYLAAFSPRLHIPAWFPACDASEVESR